MSEQILTSYFVPCLTESVDVLSDYMFSPPTVCPHNNTHIIDAANIYIAATVPYNMVSVSQTDGSVDISGYYRCDYFTYNIPASVGVTTYDISYPYDMVLYSVVLQPTVDNIGDYFAAVGYPNTPGGIITTALVPTDTTLILADVTPFFKGMSIYVTNGVTTDILGDIVSVDTTLNSITFQHPCINAYGIGSVMLFEIDRIRNGKVTNIQNIELGFSKIGSSGLKAGKVLQIRYNNTSGTAKEITLLMEINY